jgi:hypothetical protein
VGKPGKVVKEEKGGKKISQGIFWPAGRGTGRRVDPCCNSTTRCCIFSLDTTSGAAQNSGNFSVGSGPGDRSGSWFTASADGEPGTFTANGKFGASLQCGRRGNACSICRDGPCNALIRSAQLAATGCAQLTPEESCAVTAAPRSAMFRRRSAHACGCVLARSVVTVHRAARQDDCASRGERSSGRSSRPHPPGRAVPAVRQRLWAVRFSVLPVMNASPTLAKPRQPKWLSEPKPAPNQHLRWGRAARGGSGRSWGMGKFKKNSVDAELSGPIRGTGEAQEDQ